MGRDVTTANRRERDRLHLLRLRLGLAMLAMAVLPLALVSVAASLVSGPGPAAQLTVAAASTGVSEGLSAEMARVRSVLVVGAGDADVRGALAKGASAATLGSGFERVGRMAGTFVSRVAIVDAAGHERAAFQGGARVTPSSAAHPDDPVLAGALALPSGGVFVSPPVTAAGETVVTLATPIAGTSRPAGILRFDLSVSRLLAGSAADRVDAGGYAVLVDAQGSPLADTRNAATTASGPDGGLLPDVSAVITAVLARAGGAWSTLLGNGYGAGSSPMGDGIPELAGWRVLVVQRLGPPVEPALPLLIVVGVLVLVSVLLAGWMTRQVLRPAEELERSHGHLANLYEGARRDALTDPLTGLGNHRAFHETLAVELDRGRQLGLPVALMLIDLDDFKQVNDSRGHAAGDAVLAAFANGVTRSTRRGDSAYRVGGDEFAVILPGTDAESAAAVGRRLLAAALSPHPGAWGPSPATSPIPISFSAGVAVAPDHGSSVAELGSRADAALYWGKRHGRTTIEVFDAARHRPELMTVMADVDGALIRTIEGHLLRPVYQPVVSLRDGRIVGYEALIRPQPGSGFADAGALFTAAEASGRTMQLDRACIEVVAEHAPSREGGRFLSINLSPRTLEAGDFSSGAIRTMLGRHGVRPEDVVIEVTERERIEIPDQLQRNLKACRQAGFRVAADDVGAGNAGLQLLSTVRFDIVKIDLALVQEGAQRGPALAVLRSLVDMAAGWGAMVVAEGIETGQQLQTIRELGVDAAQGYLLGRPAERELAAGSIDLASLEAEPASTGPGRWFPQTVGLGG